MRLVKGTSLKRYVDTAKTKLDDYGFSAIDKAFIAERLDSWNEERGHLDLDKPSSFSYCQTIRRQAEDEGHNYPYRLIAVMLMVCHPHYPEVARYLKKITHRSRLVKEWPSFRTSSAWKFVRNRDPIPVTAVNLASGRLQLTTKEKASEESRPDQPSPAVGSPQGQAQQRAPSQLAVLAGLNPPKAPRKMLEAQESRELRGKYLLRSRHNPVGKMAKEEPKTVIVAQSVVDTVDRKAHSGHSQLQLPQPDHVDTGLTEANSRKHPPKYPFPILTKQGTLCGYTPVTTLLPANKDVVPSSPYTIRLGWHMPSGACVIGVLRAHESSMALYAAACTLDERPLAPKDVPKGKIPLSALVLISDFRWLDLKTLGEVLQRLSRGKNIQGNLQDLVDKLAPSVTKPLWKEASVGNLTYGRDPGLLPLNIKQAADQGKCLGLRQNFIVKVEEFHRQTNKVKAPTGNKNHASTLQSRNPTPIATMSRIISDPAAPRKDDIFVSENELHLDQLFEHAQSFVDKYLQAYPKKRSWPPIQQADHAKPKRGVEDISGGQDAEGEHDQVMIKRRRESSVEFIREEKIRHKRWD